MSTDSSTRRPGGRLLGHARRERETVDITELDDEELDDVIGGATPASGDEPVVMLNWLAAWRA
jgi:hypothetical protein